MPHNFSFVIPGKLAGMARPGIVSDLESELIWLRGAGIGAIASLTEQPLDARALIATRMEYLHLPVEDFAPPSPAQICDFVEFVRDQNAAGRAVAAHCGAGMGRTGTLLACYLVYLGETPVQAIDSIRSIRPGSIETPEQEAAVRSYAASLSGRKDKQNG